MYLDKKDSLEDNPSQCSSLLLVHSSLNQNGTDKREAPMAYFKKFKPIPYALPVLVSSKKRNSAQFRMHLQYIKYGNIVYKADVWDSTKVFTAEKIKALKGISKKLGVR